MLVELHSHTTYSVRSKVFIEGLNTPREMLMHAKKLGLGALAITDHDEIKGSLEARKIAKKYGVIAIPGEEITTRSGHVVALGIDKFVKPGMSVEETIDTVHDLGGITIGVHPFDIRNEGISELSRKTDAIESFNAINIERFSNKKAKNFAKIHRKPQVAGSDAHWTEMMGYGVNEIEAHSVDDILSAIKKGKARIHGSYIPSSTILRWSIMRLEFSYDEVMNYINSNYRMPKRVISRNLLGLVNRSPGKIDYLFRLFGYCGLGYAFAYSVIKNHRSSLRYRPMVF
jgi:predicted metal-dependent phosphoesterase TrpH